MIITTNEAKKHLRLELDFTDDDDYINGLIAVAEEFIKNTTGQTFDNTNPLAKTACFFIIADLYDNRTLATDKVGEKIRSIVTMILTQLSLSYGGDA